MQRSATALRKGAWQAAPLSFLDRLRWSLRFASKGTDEGTTEDGGDNAGSAS